MEDRLGRSLTQKQLQKRVEYWIKTLSPLGLGHFKVQGVHLVDETPGGPGAQASVCTSSHYDSFEMWFREEGLEDSLDEVILHELLHVAMRDYDNTVDEALDRWMPPATLAAFEEDVIYRVREGFVERCARAIAAAHRE